MNYKWRGTFTALVTPFKNNEIDFSSLKNLVAQQLAGGISGFVIHGTTGESPTVRTNEKKQIFDFVKSLVPSGFPLMAGTGSNSTEATIEATKEAKTWGADAALVVVPYYNKPPQRGLVAHFSKVADEGGLPVMLYNVPSRTVAALSTESVISLSRHKNIIGIKEASGDMAFAKAIRAEAKESFLLFSGDDATYEEFLKQGGDGIISVGSHILPKAFSEKAIQKYLPLINGIYVEANPIPVKKALQLMGIIERAELRLPLAEMDEALVPKLKDLMTAAGLVR